MRIHKCMRVAVCMGIICMLTGCGEASVEYGTFIPEVQDSSLYGRFDDAGNYITKRGILLTADQYRELRQYYEKGVIDESDRADIRCMQIELTDAQADE